MSDKNLIALADVLTAVCVREVARYCAIKIPRDLMAEIVGGVDHLEDELISHYSCATESLDTFTRDYLLDAVAKKFTTLGRWPMFNDSEEISTKFRVELMHSSEAAGCEFVEHPSAKKSKVKIFGGKKL